jgi:GH25 family lysozyme M1 (1,4-beta-N-acetylmuramidase)
MILGVDISSYQGNVNYTALPSYVRFVLSKATESTGYTNPYYRRNTDGGLRAGRVMGAYHYLTAVDGVAQADHYLAVVGDDPVILALDVEGTGCGPQVNAFLSRVDRKFPGRPVLVYSNIGMWAMVHGPARLTGNPVGWHAGYQSGTYILGEGRPMQTVLASRTLNPSTFGGLTPAMVQFTDTAGVPGISGGVDANIWLRSDAELVAMTGTATTQAPAPDPQEDDMFIVRTPSNGNFVFTQFGHFALKAGSPEEKWAVANLPVKSAGAAELTPLGNQVRENAVRVITAAVAGTVPGAAGVDVDAIATAVADKFSARMIG